jgi:hypothetical protein
MPKKSESLKDVPTGKLVKSIRRDLKRRKRENEKSAESESGSSSCKKA